MKLMKGLVFEVHVGRSECAPKLGVDTKEISSASPLLAALVLASYEDAAQVAAEALEWWRVVCDEPHGSLTATPRAHTLARRPSRSPPSARWRRSVGTGS